MPDIDVKESYKSGNRRIIVRIGYKDDPLAVLTPEEATELKQGLERLEL